MKKRDLLANLVFTDKNINCQFSTINSNNLLRFQEQQV